MQAYSDPQRESDPHALPNVEVWVEDHQRAEVHEDGSCTVWEPGFYWWACFPGCLPDSDPNGPFATEAEALADAQSNSEGQS